MKRTIAPALLAFLVLSGCSSLRVHIDYDENADFGSFQTFQFQDAEEGSLSQSDPLNHQRILDSLATHLTAAGLEKTDRDPDLIVTYYTSADQELRINTSHFGYGYPGRWHGTWGMGGSTASVSTFEIGTLVVDAWDPATDELVWRGIAESNIYQNPEKQAALIERAVAQMAHKSQQRLSR